MKDKGVKAATASKQTPYYNIELDTDLSNLDSIQSF